MILLYEKRLELEDIKVRRSKRPDCIGTCILHEWSLFILKTIPMFSSGVNQVLCFETFMPQIGTYTNITGHS